MARHPGYHPPMLLYPARLILAVVSLTLTVSCSRKETPPAAPAPTAAPAPPAPKAVEAAVAPAAEPPAVEPDSPLAVCHRDCSVEANRKQMEGYVRCDRESQAKNGDCRQKVLEVTDGQRGTCRRACEDKLTKPATGSP